MAKRYIISTLFCICGCVGQLLADDQSPITDWERSSAMTAVRSVNIDLAVSEIGDISSLSDGAATLIKLRDVNNRGDWPLPAREAVIYQFTRSLASLPRDTVAIELLQHLRNYQSRVLVPHEDHATASVPLFNVRGAVAGIENGWQRAESASTATTLIELNPAAMVSAYLESTRHNQRSGILDALGQADLANVQAVQRIALEQFESTPALTAVIGATVAITADDFATRQLLIHGRDAGLSAVLEQLDGQLQTSETAGLLEFSIDHAPASNAALAIAAWWPRLSHEPASRDLLLGLLADTALGANAALALAKGPDLQTIKALQDIASGDSVAARRAQMALDLNRARLVSGGQP